MPDIPETFVGREGERSGKLKKSQHEIHEYGKTQTPSRVLGVVQAVNTERGGVNAMVD